MSAKKKIKHTITNIQIFDTMEYDVFTLSKKNRPISQSKVHSFIELFKTGKNFMNEFPAIVDDDFTILDGQHRFMACKTLGIPFIYRAADKLSIKNVIDVQLNAGWGTLDYLHAFVQQGKQDYIILHRFVVKYGISASNAAMILGNKESTSDGLTRIGYYDGTFKAINETRGHVLMERICDFHNGGFKKAKSKCFILAIVRCQRHPEYDHSQMMDKYTKYGSSLLRAQTDTENYVRALEALYNYHQPKDRIIRFI